MTAQQSDTPGEVTRLAAELRRLRETARLSFTELGERTPYSRSAWQRYLTAKVLPPWPAVRDLCRLAGEPEPRLRALWELAESAVRARGAVMAEVPQPEPERESEAGSGEGREQGQAPKSGSAPGSESGPWSESRSEGKSGTGGPTPRRGRARLYLTLATIAVVALAAVGVYVLRDSGGTPNGSSGGMFSVTCTSGPCDPTCHAAACTGLDPQLTFCGSEGSQLIQEHTPGGADLEIRYNPQCRAAWGRFWNDHVGDTLTLAAPGLPSQTVRVTDPRQQNAFTYTPMVFVAGSTTALKVCFRSGSGAPDCYTATTGF